MPIISIDIMKIIDERERCDPQCLSWDEDSLLKTVKDVDN